MNVALLYPPPWKIPEPDEAPDVEAGPPEGYRPGDLDGDFYQTPYGLYALAAAAKRAGHAVKVINLSAYPWRQVREVVAALDADLFGLSCWTANRRGVGYCSKLIKELHPSAHLVVGGPHASPLANEMLQHHPAIDTVTTGESDQTFLELLERLERADSVQGLAGAFYRNAGGIEQGPKRKLVADLDALACPQDYFDSHILMTSRGCPWACTFCGAEAQWGRGFRGQSVNYVLDAIEKLLDRLPVKMLLIKDDTFTTNEKRILELCQGIRERKLRFLWSCDTRVDLLSDKLLREMRLAGCQRLSLGVESGSQRIIHNVDKRIRVEDILKSTRLAKKYGIHVRYFMMLGNRGETCETFRETLAFLEEARPHEYIFSCLSLYPGTRDFREAEQSGWLSRELYFTKNFQELKVPYDADEACTKLMNDWFQEHAGLQRMHRPGVAEAQQTLELLDGHHAAELDLARALYEDERLDEAKAHAQLAIDAGLPVPGLALNYLAVIAARQGDYQGMMDIYSKAAKLDPQHYILIENVNKARAWFRKKGPERELPLELRADHEFQLLEQTKQPSLPGPLSEGFSVFDDVAEKLPNAGGVVTRVGSNKLLDSRGRLKVVD